MKLELRENMYVRTEKGIAKIKKIFPDGSEPYFEAKYETDTYLEIYYDSEYVSEDDVLKASYNIIDILEVGDVIIDKEGHKYPINYEFETDYNDEYKSYEITIDDYITLFLKDGLSIVTKEQMEQKAYKVVE